MRVSGNTCVCRPRPWYLFWMSDQRQQGSVAWSDHHGGATCTLRTAEAAINANTYIGAWEWLFGSGSSGIRLYETN